MLTKLPSAWFAGLKIEDLQEDSAAISIKYKWFNKNPFRSIYVGILSMPAEVSTGILCMGAIYKRSPSVSMLAVGMNAKFIKKVTGKVTFICNDGSLINEAIDRSIMTKAAVEVACKAVGTNQSGETVAEFEFIWSFKPRH